MHSLDRLSAHNLTCSVGDYKLVLQNNNLWEIYKVIFVALSSTCHYARLVKRPTCNVFNLSKNVFVNEETQQVCEEKYAKKKVDDYKQYH